jgi:hypothetical protein
MARRTVKPAKAAVNTPELAVDAPAPEYEVAQEEDAAPQTDAPVHLWTLIPMALGALLLLVGQVTPQAETPFPLVVPLADALGWLAIGLAAAGLGAGKLALGRAELPTWLLAAAACTALVAFRLRECAFPLLSTQATEPLRTSLQALTLPIGAAIALAGALTLQSANFRAARAWLGLGVALLGVVVLWPQGWLGSTVVPLWTALAGLQVPTTSNGLVQMQPGALAGGGQVLAAALLTGVALWTLLQKDLPRMVALVLTGGLALLALAQPVLSNNLAHACAGAGALLLAAGALGQAIVRGDVRQGWQKLWPGVEVVAVLVILAAWLVLKANGTRYSTTDEALYYYAARLWSEGKWPYRDFFFSHPPLHIAVPALAYKLLGYDFLVGKWLSVLASLGAAVATWRIARRLLGVPAGLLALAMDLFAAEVLQASTNLTGVNLTTCWMMWGVWAILRGRMFLGGALLGAAAATGFYALGMTLAIVGMLLFVPFDRKNLALRSLLAHPAIRVLLGFLAVWGTITALGILLAGDRYVTEVFTYHFAKKAKLEGFLPVSGGPPAWFNNLFLMFGAKDFTVVLYYHAVHLWLALVAPIAVGLQIWLNTRNPPPRKLNEASPWRALWLPRTWWQQPNPGHRMVLFTAALALVGEFGQFKERYDFYWALILPLLSICAAVTVQTLFTLGAAAIRANKPDLDKHSAAAGYAALWLAALTMLAVPVNNNANHRAYPSEFKQVSDSKGLGEQLGFEWLDPPGPPWLGQLTRAAFWGEGRLRGNIESGVHHYLWNKKRWYSTADEMAAWIRDHSKPNETITGASDYAPLLALLSGRRLAGDVVDTNSKVFDTGAARLEDFWDAACKDNLKYIVVAPMSYFAVAQLPKRATIMQHFQQEKVFHDPKLKHWKDLEMELWVRKGDGPCKFEGRRGTGPDLQGTD